MLASSFFSSVQSVNKFVLLFEYDHLKNKINA